jgi:hypothetical protein
MYHSKFPSHAFIARRGAGFSLFLIKNPHIRPQNTSKNQKKRKKGFSFLLKYSIIIGSRKF